MNYQKYKINQNLRESLSLPSDDVKCELSLNFCRRGKLEFLVSNI